MMLTTDKIFIILKILYLNHFISFGYGWNLTNIINITKNDQYKIIHISIFYIRAYLCIEPINDNDYLKNDAMNHLNLSLTTSPPYRLPTLIETTWPENIQLFQPRAYPNEYYHIHNDNDYNCNGILQAKYTIVDKSKGILWILDNGSRYCSPKILAFNLFKPDEELHRFVFNEYNVNAFSAIKLLHTNSILCLNSNSNYHKNSTIQLNCLIIIGKSFCILYTTIMNNEKFTQQKFFINLLHLKLIKFINLHLRRSDPIGLKTNNNNPVVLMTEIKDICINQNDFYVLDMKNNLWIVNTLSIRNSYHSNPNCNIINLTLNFIGQLLGNANSLTIDPNGISLYYHLIRDGAILRWNLQKFLIAENHDVLFLSSQTIIQIVFGAKGSVWIIYEMVINGNNSVSSSSSNQHCQRILYNYLLNSQFQLNCIDEK